MKIGDEFYITNIKKTIAYGVDSKKVVLPTDFRDIEPVAGKDYVTLMTSNGMTDSSERILINCDRVEEKCILSNTDIGSKNKGGTTQSHSRKKVCMAVAVFGTAIIGAVSFLLLGRVFRSHNQGLKM